MRRDARSPGGRDSAGASHLYGAADGFGHPADFVFCGLSHEEERQGVTGEVEKAFPVPGGIGLGVRDEGRGREVRREDGAEAVYVPQELGVPALHTSGGVEGGEAAHCAPLRMSSSPAMCAEAYRSIASIVWQVAEKRDWMP